VSFFKALLSNQPIHRDAGVFVLRVGIGLTMLLLHGYGKITGGSETWAMLGSNMSHLGISFAPKFWGFMAAFAEFFGSLFLVLGIFFRPAAAILAFTMIVAMSRHLSLPAGEPGAGWNGASHALELCLVYVALFLTGPGRFSLRSPSK